MVADLNGDAFWLQTEHQRVRLRARRTQAVEPATAIALDADADCGLLTRSQWVQFEEVGPEQRITHYSQRDPRWRDVEYAGGLTFGAAGCYVTCVAMVLSLAGYTDTPPEVASKLHYVGAFVGANLSNAYRIPDAYPLTVWDGRHDWDGPADVDVVRAELARGPTILEVDYNETTATQEQHFVVAVGLVGDDIEIVDPWDGATTRLMERYALDHWDLARAVYGLRLLRVG